MKAIKSMLTVLMLVIGVLTILGASEDSNLWDLGSPNDWLSTGPVNHTGPFSIRTATSLWEPRDF